jgi:F1F0 ATPase subunit 2
MTLTAISPAVLLPVALLVGLLLGTLHFTSLLTVAEGYADRRVGRAALLQFLRMAVVIAMLYGLAQTGAGALLAGAFGMLVSRIRVVGRVRRQL